MKNELQENLFTGMDYAIVRAAVKRLPGLLGAVIEMRFWQKLTLGEIAVELGVSIKAVESALIKAGRALREECLRHPAFSRSEYEALQLMHTQNVA